MRLYSVAAVYALWILGVFVTFYLGHANDTTGLQLAVMFGAIPAALQLFLLGFDGRGLVAAVKLWLAFILVILLSYVASGMNPQTAPIDSAGLPLPAAWIPIVYTLNTVFIIAVATLVSGCPDRRLLRSIASLYCVFSTPFLLYICLTGEMLWGRLVANGLQSNNWGLMGFTVCIAAFARKPGPLAIAGFAAGVETILLASSREHLLALAAVLLVVVVLYLQTPTRFRLWAMLAGSCVTFILVALLLDPYILNAVRYVNHDILMVDSANRGLDSGFTGRTDIWAASIDLWLKYPILGVGFRQHEMFLNGLPAHNAFLAILADTGVFGLIVYLVVLIGSLIASWNIQDQRTRRFVLTAIVGYIVIGFFDRRTIDSGNPYSLLFVMCCSVALVDQSLRKAAVSSQKQFRRDDYLQEGASERTA